MKSVVSSLILAATFVGGGAFCSAAHADQFSATITADNHYALYTSSAGIIDYLGGNELGSAGSAGSYNWSMAESYQFQAQQFLYIAAWSDDSTAQGVLAQFDSPSWGTILSGDPRWQVYATGAPRGDGDPHPGASEIAAFVADADAAQAWEMPFVGATNGAQPWGTIAGIQAQAAWMWHSQAGDADPTLGAPQVSEMQIFRTAIPAPSAAAMAFIGVALAVRRRR